jgi:chromosome segregation ATPase
METKLDKINERLSSIDTHLAVYNEQLREHIRRSQLNEEAVTLLKNEMQPLRRHVDYVNFVFKALLFLASVSALLRVL